MFFKKVFDKPELLLLFSLIIGPIFGGSAILHVQLHENYYVFGGGHKWYGNTLFLAMDLLLCISWLQHTLLRRDNLLPQVWRWIQVGISILSLIVLVVISNDPVLAKTNTSEVAHLSMPDTVNPVGVSPTSSLQAMTWMAYSLVAFIASQFFFWVIAASLLMKFAKKSMIGKR